LPCDAEYVKSLDMLTQRIKSPESQGFDALRRPSTRAQQAGCKRSLRPRHTARHDRRVPRFLALARIALTLVVAIVIGLGVLGSSRVASACMRLSLVEAPCCAAMRAPVRVESPESCCRAGTLGKARAADLERAHGDVADAPCVAQPMWAENVRDAHDAEQRSLVPTDRARPPPRAPHLAFTVLRC
jgi:hypothetical protein